MASTSAASSLTAEADALRTEMAACLQSLTGERSSSKADEPAAGVEERVDAFMERAKRLQVAFARAEHAAVGEEGETAALRADIASLKEELRIKDELLAVHRERVERWRGECDAVAAQASQL